MRARMTGALSNAASVSRLAVSHLFRELTIRSQPTQRRSHRRLWLGFAAFTLLPSRQHCELRNLTLAEASRCVCCALARDTSSATPAAKARLCKDCSRTPLRVCVSLFAKCCYLGSPSRCPPEVPA